jgi:hypothetical protein
MVAIVLQSLQWEAKRAHNELEAKPLPWAIAYGFNSQINLGRKRPKKILPNSTVNSVIRAHISPQQR